MECNRSTRASIDFQYKDHHLSYVVTFNNVSEIVELETKRFMTKKKLETWIVKLADYKVMNGIRIPQRAEVLWRLPNGDYPYARFNVSRLEYGISSKF